MPDHFPVLLRESLDWLNIVPDGTYVDATCGLGGHSIAIAERLAGGKVIACDRDPESLELARRNAGAAAERIIFVRTEHSNLRASVEELKLGKTSGLIADLGVSLYQLTTPVRGFSLQSSGPLDMRMNRTSGLTAGDIVNQYSERDIADLLWHLADERRSRQIARAIVRSRPIADTRRLAEIVAAVSPRTGRLDPATLTFLALRRAVNSEEEELDALLDAAPELVKGGGRVVIISFMNLEDRKVKHKFQALAREGRGRILTKHVVKPAEEETRINRPSRSAHLRALEIV